ncbi:hypothetical protein Hanom_Chr17g01577731 [Helianthus anomalus]
MLLSFDCNHISYDHFVFSILEKIYHFENMQHLSQNIQCSLQCTFVLKLHLFHQVLYIFVSKILPFQLSLHISVSKILPFQLSFSRPVAKVIAALSLILQSFELTTPRVGLARPRVGCYFCLLQFSFSSAQYPSLDTTRVSLLFLLF